MDAADLGSGDDDRVGFLAGEEIKDRGLVAEVEFAAGGGDGVESAEFLCFANERRPDHAAVSGDVDFVHGGGMSDGLKIIGVEKSQVLRSKVEGQGKRGKHSEALNFKHEIRNEEYEEAASDLASSVSKSSVCSRSSSLFQA